MAEAWCRVLHGDRIDAYSAGTAPKPIDPRAGRVMEEAGIDISAQRSKHVEEMAATRFDAVVTVCDSAKEACPTFANAATKLHVSFDDPPRLAANLSGEEALDPYRRVRDEIRMFVQRLPDALALANRGVEPARESDLASVLALLNSVDLPTNGVRDFFPAAYSVIRTASAVVAVAGVESYESVGLLRSVAVAGSHRGLGLGQIIVEERLAFARDNNLDAVYLLTTTAATFFQNLGFETIQRSAAPASLLASSEFASVCPSTAACLVKRLS